MNRGESAVRDGEQFCEDLRATRGRTLSTDRLRELTTLSSVRSAASVAQTVIITLVVLGVALAWLSIWVLLPAVFVIATQQHAMFVLAHEAAHYRLFPSRRINDAVGRLLAALAGLSMCTYRVVHRLHHNHLYDERDPDIALHGGYPRGRAYLLRKFSADLLGLTAWKTYRYFLGSPAANARTGVAQRPLDDTSTALRRAAQSDRWLVAAVQIGMPLAVTVLFGWRGLAMYLLLWIIPAVTVLQAILRLRAICEHGAPPGIDSPLQAARTTIAGPLLRFIMFPHHVNYHIEHHLYPAVPHYSLPRLHQTLAQSGILNGAEIRSFAATWRRVYAPSLPL
ncbi:MAG: fatty acid desaturase family protein [Betaproteobacteria bacterium]|nr:MAG: fatty acid desaturase family protein [Betaproteobacteria bacterium]